MKDRDLINRCLKSLGNSIGNSTLAIGDNGVCAFDYDGKFDFFIEHPDSSSVVYLFALLVKIPKSQTEPLLRHILTLNFCNYDTAGASFAIDQVSGKIAICYQHPVDYLNEVLFKNIVNNFVAAAETWQEKLQQFINDLAQKTTRDTSVRPSQAGYRV